MNATATKEVQRIMSKIVRIPTRPPFMLDRDVAEVYGTTTKYVNRAVKRNPERFPADFCFQLTREEVAVLERSGYAFDELEVTDCDLKKDDQDKLEITDCDLKNGREKNFAVPDWNRNFSGKNMRRYLPYGFTREGCNMLSAVLNTPIAIDRSILIIRAFTALEKGAFRQPGDAPDSPILPNGWQMCELRLTYGVEKTQKILAEYFGIAIDRYKYGITPWEAQVIKKDNPNKNSRDAMICELVNRGVAIELVATLSGYTKPSIYSIINYERKTTIIEKKEDGENG